MLLRILRCSMVVDILLLVEVEGANNPDEYCTRLQNDSI